MTIAAETDEDLVGLEPASGVANCPPAAGVDRDTHAAGVARADDSRLATRLSILADAGYADVKFARRESAGLQAIQALAGLIQCKRNRVGGVQAAFLREGRCATDADELLLSKKLASGKIVTAARAFGGGEGEALRLHPATGLNKLGVARIGDGEMAGA